MTRRGVTFLEVALAIALLAGLAASVTAAFAGLRRSALFEQEKLNAMEVAHRVIVGYMNDPATVPKPDEYVEQGAGRYRVLFAESMLVEERGSSDETFSLRKPVPIKSATDNERLGAGLIMVTVRVFPYDESGPLPRDTMLAELSRLYDPYASDQHEDVFMRHVMRLLGEDMSRMLRIKPEGSPR